MRRRRAIIGALGLALVASGCASIVPPEVPRCDPDLRSDAVLIEAQSVPSAAMVPCVSVLPVGWSFQSFQVDDRGTTFYLDSDRAGFHAVRVDLMGSCDTGSATQVPTDTPGTDQFERIDSIGDTYGGVRYYVFEGGCVTYRFEFEGTGRTELAREVSLAIDFVPRSAIDKVLAEEGLDS